MLPCSIQWVRAPIHLTLFISAEDKADHLEACTALLPLAAVAEPVAQQEAVAAAVAELDAQQEAVVAAVAEPDAQQEAVAAAVAEPVAQQEAVAAARSGVRQPEPSVD